MRTFQTEAAVLAVSLLLALIGCSSSRKQIGKYNDDEDPIDVPGTSNPPAEPPPSTGNAPDAAGKRDTGGCQTFDYATYQAMGSMLTLKTDIMPILADSCSLTKTCHSNDSMTPPRLGPVGGKVDAAGLLAIGAELSANSLQVPVMKFVVAGKPEDSYLMNKIDGTATCMGFDCKTSMGCGTRMPQLLDPLKASDIEKVRAWIKQGAATM